MIAALRRLIGRESGAVTVEFVLWFPLFFGVFLSSVESGILMLRYIMLERGLDVTVRDLRIGTLALPDHDDLKREICRNSLILPDCIDSLSVELQRVSTTTWQMPPAPVACIDRSEEVQPVTTVSQGGANDLMLIRVCSKFEPILPTSVLGLSLRNDGAGNYALVAASAFVNEP